MADAVQEMPAVRKAALALVLGVGIAGVGLAVAHPQVFRDSTAEAGMPGFVAPDQDEDPVDERPAPVVVLPAPVDPPAEEPPVVELPVEEPVVDDSPVVEEPDEDDRGGRRTERDLREWLDGDRTGPRG